MKERVEINNKGIRKKEGSDGRKDRRKSWRLKKPPFKLLGKYYKIYRLIKAISELHRSFQPNFVQIGSAGFENTSDEQTDARTHQTHRYKLFVSLWKAYF